jgi:hypothetical protein
MQLHSAKNPSVSRGNHIIQYCIRNHYRKRKAGYGCVYRIYSELKPNMVGYVRNTDELLYVVCLF